MLTYVFMEFHSSSSPAQPLPSGFGFKIPFILSVILLTRILNLLNLIFLTGEKTWLPTLLTTLLKALPTRLTARLSNKIKDSRQY